MASSVVYSELYRAGTLGKTLTDSIDDLVVAGKLEPQLAARVLQQFDKTMEQGFGGLTRAKTSFKGRLHVYRLCDNVWNFELQDVTFKMENGKKVEAKKVKVVAYSCDAK